MSDGIGDPAARGPREGGLARSERYCAECEGELDGDGTCPFCAKLHGVLDDAPTGDGHTAADVRDWFRRAGVGADD